MQLHINAHSMPPTDGIEIHMRSPLVFHIYIECRVSTKFHDLQGLNGG